MEETLDPPHLHLFDGGVAGSDDEAFGGGGIPVEGLQQD
jgi:hypothetical protein